MKTWMKRTLVGLLGAGVFLGGLAAWAHERHDRAWQPMTDQQAAEMKTRVMDRIGSQLALDPNQKALLGVLADKLREQQLALRGAQADPRAEIQGLIAGPTFDRGAASALIEAKIAAVNAKSPEVVAALGNFYDSLQPAQQAQVRDFVARHHSGHHTGPHKG